MSDQTAAPLRVMVVDDEPLARQRLASLLERVPQAVTLVAQCGDAGAALSWLEAHPHDADVCFLDIQMPGPDGLRLADKIRTLPEPPLVVFVTAHAEHALRAFELDACDYLTKPVRLDRLVQAVQRCRRQRPAQILPAAPTSTPDALVVQERDRILRVPVPEILYLKAELKYVTLRTIDHAYVIDESLSDLHERLGDAFIRIHRNALVARHAMQRLERRDDPDGTEGWAVQVGSSGEWLVVSRRQVPLVREALRAG